MTLLSSARCWLPFKSHPSFLVPLSFQPATLLHSTPKAFKTIYFCFDLKEKKKSDNMFGEWKGKLNFHKMQVLLREMPCLFLGWGGGWTKYQLEYFMGGEHLAHFFFLLFFLLLLTHLICVLALIPLPCALQRDVRSLSGHRS